MKVKQRIIFDNYNTDEYEEDCREWLIENGNTDPSDEDIMGEIQFRLDTLWDDVKHEMDNAFRGKRFLAVGICERWDGKHSGGFIFSNFDELINHFSDCGYFKIWDENGKLFLEASHHDGTDCIEIKRITSTGEQYYNNWRNAVSDHRTEREIHSRMISDSHYTNLVNFVHDAYGCPMREYLK